jgi:hypothetical protein
MEKEKIAHYLMQGPYCRCTCTCHLVQYVPNVYNNFIAGSRVTDSGVSNSKLLVYQPYSTLLCTQKRMQGREIRVKSRERRHWHPRVLTLLAMI